MARIEEVEIPLRGNLDQTFKPIFEQHEETGGIPLNLLQEQLEKYNLQKDLPPGGLAALLQRADQDKDGILDYEEFIHLVTKTAPGVIKPKHLSRFNRAMRGAVSSVVPVHLVDDYMEHYNCKPPPLFMITVSLVEVIVFIYYCVDLKDSAEPVSANAGVPLYGPFIFNPSRRYEVWRYLTYMLIHRGYVYDVINVMMS
ncbi:Rhomboid-related protein 3 [Lamellibrachia satsuma]|nr:Rhomboid-related protein 3 [Lamellibrachia satsuma]